MIHEESIKSISPQESLNILNHGALESAVNTPQQTFDGNFLYPTLTEMAVAYLFGLALNHAFENGNKRVAYATCSTFLRMNGYMMILNQDEAVDLTLKVVVHQITREEVVDILNEAIISL